MFVEPNMINFDTESLLSVNFGRGVWILGMLACVLLNPPPPPLLRSQSSFKPLVCVWSLGVEGRGGVEARKQGITGGGVGRGGWMEAGKTL